MTARPSPRRPRRARAIRAPILFPPAPRARSWWGSDEPWSATDASRQLFAEIAFRWAMLHEWGVRDKIPYERPASDAWIAYEAAWREGDAEPADLNGFAAELGRVEIEARELGFVPRGQQIQGVDPDALSTKSEMHSEVQQTVAAVEEQIEEATQKVREAADEAKGGLGVLLLAAAAIAAAWAGLVWIPSARAGIAMRAAGVVPLRMG